LDKDSYLNKLQPVEEEINSLKSSINPRYIYMKDQPVSGTTPSGDGEKVIE
jgi:hypothetical protein